MLRSIVRQFGNQEQSAYDLLSELFEKCREMTPSLSAEILRELLQKMMQKFGEAYIILDALDECAERHELLNLLAEIANNIKDSVWPTSSSVRILVTSRREPDIEEYLRRIQIPDSSVIGLRGEHINADIQNFVRATLLSDYHFARLQRGTFDTLRDKEEKDELRFLVERKIMEKADSM